MLRPRSDQHVVTHRLRLTKIVFHTRGVCHEPTTHKSSLAVNTTHPSRVAVSPPHTGRSSHKTYYTLVGALTQPTTRRKKPYIPQQHHKPLQTITNQTRNHYKPHKTTYRTHQKPLQTTKNTNTNHNQPCGDHLLALLEDTAGNFQEQFANTAPKTSMKLQA